LCLKVIRFVRKHCLEVIIAEEKRMHRQKPLISFGVTASDFYQQISKKQELELQGND